MMIAVIDYGMGNLRSIAKALEYVGGDVCVTSDHEQITQADRLVLPGVGAFGDGMSNLQSRGLVEVLTEQVLEHRKPFWGICLGMQLLAQQSEEFGAHTGLGWVDATVVRFAPADATLKVPHVGWNTVEFAQSHPLIDGVGDQADFYFVHSYYVQPSSDAVTVGHCTYGEQFCACLTQDNIFATQFHPEKSQKDGLQLLTNFLTWTP